MAMVVWFATSFGWTEIVFDVFLQKIFNECEIDAKLVRKCRYYAKGPKPTRNPDAARINTAKSGYTGVRLLREIYDTMKMEIDNGNELPDMLIISDDTDCRVVYDGSCRRYIYNSHIYREEVVKIEHLVHDANQETKIIFMLAAPEVEAWFLADCRHSFCNEFSGFTLQKLNMQCGGIFPIAELENFSTLYMGDSCEMKLSEDCITQFQGVERYSKRIQGQEFLQKIEPSAVCSLRYFFRPAYDAVKNGTDFIPM